MAKTWRKYESLILYSPELDTDASEALVERFRDFIRSADGRMLKTERWGVRDTAFEIKGNKKAYYVLLEYAGEGPVSLHLAHQLNLLDMVIKFQTIKLADRVDPDDLPETEEITGDLDKKQAPGLVWPGHSDPHHSPRLSLGFRPLRPSSPT